MKIRINKNILSRAFMVMVGVFVYLVLPKMSLISVYMQTEIPDNLAEVSSIKNISGEYLFSKVIEEDAQADSIGKCSTLKVKSHQRVGCKSFRGKDHNPEAIYSDHARALQHEKLAGVLTIIPIKMRIRTSAAGVLSTLLSLQRSFKLFFNSFNLLTFFTELSEKLPRNFSTEFNLRRFDPNLVNALLCTFLI